MYSRVRLIIIAFILACSTTFATCPGGNNEVIVQIIPDGYPHETSWELVDISGAILASGGSTGDTVCVPSNSCTQFIIRDSYGDGIFAPGGYWLYVDGNLATSGAAFGTQAAFQFNCPPGAYCPTPLPINTGSFTSLFDDTWYSFTPAQTGTYNLSTCTGNSCNTQIWIYDICPGLPYPEDAPGSYAYNDDYCGDQASLNVMLVAGTPYYFRIGDSNDDCNGTIDFTFSYVGPVQGCTDPTSCNFNPLAVIDDGSCIFFPDPACVGPDLRFDSVSFVSSLSMSPHTAATCDVAEGCVTGYGQRYVLQFTSKIDNIGPQDYYIGTPSSQPNMFNLNNCHGHAHYEGYGDYRLFDLNGNIVPAGHKNGFCVMDLCGMGQYTCGNMGISSGCYDVYGAGTQCQWLDLTDVPDGDYRVAVIINSQHLPDALGRYEQNFLNNALQVCINITRSAPGAMPTFTLLPSCAPYVDCAGVPGGASEPDCNGICNGPGYFGDTYSDQTLDAQDVETYLDMIQSNFPTANCYDLNADGELSVMDAALVNWCRNGNPNHPGGSVHNHCQFPRSITNPTDSIGLTITDINFSANYVDVAVKNPQYGLKAYQFALSGVTISSVVSLTNPIEFPVDVRFLPNRSEIFAVSLQDSLLDRSTIFQPLVRIYFSAITDTTICISRVIDLVNEMAENASPYLENACRAAMNTAIAGILSPANIAIVPNPAESKASIHLPAGFEEIEYLELMDAAGRQFHVPVSPMKDRWFSADLSRLGPGVYFIQVKGSGTFGVARLVRY